MIPEIVIRPERLKDLKTSDAVYRSVYDCYLTEQDSQQAYAELGETEELKTECLEKLKKMLSRDTVVEYRTDDSYLLRYLRYTKFDCKRAYKIIQKFYKHRVDRHDLFSLPPNTETLLNMGVIKWLPYRDEEGSIILWIDTKKWILKELPFCSLLQMANAFADVLSANPSAQVNALVGVYDFGGLTAGHFAQYLNPSTLMLMLQCLQENYPWRVKRVVGVRCNKFLRAAYHTISFMIKKKISERIVLLGSDFTELHHYIPQHLLPKEYGGPIDESECSITGFIMDNLKYLNYERSFCNENLK